LISLSLKFGVNLLLNEENLGNREKFLKEGLKAQGSKFRVHVEKFIVILAS
jgi:hypothetical protein